MFFEGIAWAQAAGAGQQNAGQQALFTTIIPIALLFGIFYFLLIRPQTKKASEHAKMLKDLKRNDEVVTTGGLIGRITELGDRLVTLEIAPNVRVRVERPQVSSLSPYGKTPSKKEKGE
ncbi:MAG TPA: preprotein translocase subunit YajC [Candidatus Binataceae bacterium]|nr:preprotein translocase subunit YajC [Candidatus Binataceae bacterium]